MKQPHAGGRYYRETDGTLTRADENGEKPTTAANVATNTAGSKPAKGATMKDKTDA